MSHRCHRACLDPLVRRFRLRRAVVALASLCVSATLAGAGSDDSKPSPGASKTLVLFDGKSLDGWKKTDFSHPGDVKVEDGTLVMATGRPMTGITCTRTDLPRTDYEFRYEAKRLEGSDFFAAATFPVGKSYITLVNGGWGGNVTGLSSLDGSDASENETGRFIKYENKTWYRFRVRVTSKVIRAWIDEKKVVDVDVKDREVGTRVETHASRPLGFATWDTAGALRNITVRPLSPSEVAETEK
jgi:hypothetical protein